MRATAAEIGFKRRSNFAIARLRVDLQQRMRSHHHAGDAIAALCRLLLDKRTLQRTRLRSSSEPLEGHDLPPRKPLHRHQTGKYRLAVDDDGTCPALPEAATELGGVKTQNIAQDIEQRRARVAVKRDRMTVDMKS